MMRAASSSRVLRELAAPVREDLLGSSHARSLGRAAALRLQGSRDDQLYVFADGVAKEHVLACSGEDRITGLVGPGASVGIETVFAGAPASTCVTCLSPATVVVIPGAAIRDAITRCPAVGREIIAELSVRFAAAVDARVEQTATAAPERVVARLVDLVDGWSVPTESGMAITAPVTQEELGSWAGVSRETVGKVLHDLREAGLLTTGRRQLVVTRPAELRRWRPAIAST